MNAIKPTYWTFIPRTGEWIEQRFTPAQSREMAVLLDVPERVREAPRYRDAIEREGSRLVAAWNAEGAKWGYRYSLDCPYPPTGDLGGACAQA